MRNNNNNNMYVMCASVSVCKIIIHDDTSRRSSGQSQTQTVHSINLAGG